MIKVQDLDFYYKTDQQRVVLDSVNLSIEPGEFLTILGRNGSGKSTILKSIAGQLALLGGTIMLGSSHLEEMSLSRRAQTMAVLLTERLRTEMMTCEDVVATGRYPYTGRFGILSEKDREAVAEAMKLVQVEKLKDQDAPQTDGSVEISSISSRMGKTTVELSHISKSYDSRVLIRDFTYIFLKNDRIGFVGANGSGKTTLMKIIDQRIQPDEGTVTIGQTIKIGYYTQEIENTKDAGIAYMDPNEKVIDYIKNTAECVRTKDGLVSASNMLERFLFPSSQQYSPIGKLSGGEKRRLNLLRVLMEAPNVLILDEPTNDLDIRTLTILEDYLDNYDGIVITVSHDRYFLDRVVNRIFAFEEDGKICQYEGGYTDYVNRLAEEGKVPAGHILDAKNDTTTSVDSVEKENQTSSMDTWKRERKLKFSYKEQKEYETIEDDIAALEQKIEELDAQTLKFSSDFVKLNEITKEKEQTEQLLEEKMERWEYLEDLAAKIAGQQ